MGSSLSNKSRIYLLEEQVRKLTERVEDLEDELLKMKLKKVDSEQDKIRD